MRQHLPVISRIIGGLFGIAVGCVIGGIAVAGVAITILVTGVISLGFISMAAGLLMLAIGLCAAGLLVLVCGKFLPWFAKGIANYGSHCLRRKGALAHEKALKIIFGIALGCFLLGCVVLGIGIATGGTMREFVEAVQNNKFAFHWDVTDWEGQDKGTASTEETAFAPEDVKSLDIDMDAGMLKVVKGKGKEIKVITTSKNAEVETALEDGTLIISENFHAAYWGDGVHRLQVVIEVPEQLELEELSVEVGAGDIDIKEGLLTTAYASLDVDAGNLDFAGEVKGDLDANCNVGNMELKLTGEQQDYNYSLSCGVGSIKAGDISVAGLGRDDEIDNGADYDMDINCDVGNVDVIFEKR